MGSTRAGGVGEPAGRDAGLLTSAAGLRWVRPDLTAAIADHVLEAAAIAGDEERWLEAAGWALHARSATGDGRETASDVIGSLSRWGRSALDGPAARRLRIELALVAAGAGEVESARGLLGPVVVDETEPELRADLHCALARCAVEDAPDKVAGALRSATAAWTRVAGPAAEVGAASVALISAVVERRGRRPDAAVDQAAEGLTRLERGRGDGPSGTPSGHLAAALAAEWISALLDAGRVDEAREGCVPLMSRLAEPARPSRQLALLRLTVARAVATGPQAGSSVGLLAQAAEDAATSDAPDLESVCRTALGALQEQTGHLETALETLRLGVNAERRDRTRMARFRSALQELPAGALRTEPRAPSTGRALATTGPAANGHDPAVSGTYDWESFLRNADGTGRPLQGASADDEPVRRRHEVSGGDRRESRLYDYRADRDDHRGDQREEQEAERRSRRTAETGTGWEAVSWDSSAGESPIGDRLFRGLGSDEHRNGSNGSNGSNGRRLQADGDGRHEASSGRSRSERSERAEPPERPEREEPTRNGRSRSRHGESARDTGGWPSVEARDEDRAASRRRENGSADRERPSPGEARDTGRRHRADDGRTGNDRAGAAGSDPWSTGQWPAAGGTNGSSHGRADNRAGRPAAPTDDPERWLQEALADLDRIWGTNGPGAEQAPSERRSGTRRPAAEPAGRCAVVIDVARDGRRFAGPRAGAVVRAVADRLTDRLPPGARLRLGESDALSISMPGWDAAAATDWMHRTLPGLLSGFDAGEDLPSAQLRAAVHDADGPVGAQLLQSLERPRERRERSFDDWPSDRRRVSERAAAPEPDGWSWEGTSGPPRSASERSPDRAAGRAVPGPDTGNGGGHRRRREAETSSARDEPGPGGLGSGDAAPEKAAPVTPESTEGLGIADLLAGALAAYRAI
ncbi:hypothetical protein BJF78_35185 [Pseudonocardia sp. CNS-139]|nr:hypothetical protein BJF78_35185 [Pseudonocardia sp. CNS-139]